MLMTVTAQQNEMLVAMTNQAMTIRTLLEVIEAKKG